MIRPMRHRIDRLLDETGWRVLTAVQENARIPFSELGRKVGLSAPAVAERVRRMEDAGIIAGYRVRLGLEPLGRPIIALIRINCPEPNAARVKALARELDDVLECHHLTGADSFIVRVAVATVKHLETVIESFGRYGTPTTALILSSPVADRAITRPAVAPRTKSAAVRPGARSTPARRPP
jgi:Lrp/AsnC family transcriptional regulator, leucine-responsive regulatory protein